MISAKHNGTSKPVTDLQAKQNETWKGVRRSFAKEGGEWLLAYEAPLLTPRKDMIRFRKTSKTALVPTGQHDNATRWHNSNVLNPTIIELNGTVHMYFRGFVGTDDSRHAVGHWSQPADTFDPWAEWSRNDSAPIIHPDDVTSVTWGTGERRLANPCATVKDGVIYLVVICRGANGTGTGLHAGAPTVLFTSTDGVNFTEVGPLKQEGEGTTIHTGGIGIQWDGTEFIMICRGQSSASGGFEKAVRWSADGINWSWPANGAFPNPDDITDNDFDDESWVTARLVTQGNYNYAFIGGGGDSPDWPEGISLYRQTRGNAWSAWEEYAHNPVMLRGDQTTPDSAALWSASVIELKGQLHMVYEGAGRYGGTAGDTDNVNARSTQYYQYDSGTYSSVLHSVCPLTDLGAAWTSTPISAGSYHIRSLSNGAFLCHTGSANGSPVRTRFGDTPSGYTFTITKDNEFFTFATYAGGPILEVAGFGNSESDAVRVWARGTGDNRKQEWHLIAVESQDGNGGLFYIQNRQSGLFLTSGANYNLLTDEAVPSQKLFDGSLAQQWVIMPN